MSQLRKRDIASAFAVLSIPSILTIWSATVGRRPEWLPDAVTNTVMRWLLTAAWLGAAVGLVWTTAVRDGLIHSLAAEARRKRTRAREQAITHALEGILTTEYTFPRKWDLTVYLFDTDADLLTPFWPPQEHEEGREVREFRPGCGATGQAWEQEEMIVRIGDEVSDGTHGLTAQQQQLFAGRRAVAATPIYDDTDDKIGVLSAISSDEDERFAQPRHASHFQAIATSIGALIVALRTN